jgi:hypothetical protein
MALFYNHQNLLIKKLTNLLIQATTKWLAKLEAKEEQTSTPK